MLTLTGCIGAGENAAIKDNGPLSFPSVTGIDLLGNERSLPANFTGQLNIVAVAFQRQQQQLVDSWIKAAEQIIANYPQVRFYELPVIYKTNALYRTWINNGMRAGIPETAARQRTITLYTDRQRFTQLLNMQQDHIYVLLLNNKGKILWRTKDAADADKIAVLKARIVAHKSSSSAT
jgi:hypothetical protein